MSSAIINQRRIINVPSVTSAAGGAVSKSEKNSIQQQKELTPIQEGFKTTQDNIAKKLEEIKKKIEESEGSESGTGADSKKLFDSLKKEQEQLEKLAEENKAKALLSNIKEQIEKEREEQQKILEAQRERMISQSLLDYQEYRKYLRLRETLVNQRGMKGLDLSIGFDVQRSQENQFTHDNQSRQHQALNLEGQKEVIGRFTAMVNNERSHSVEIEQPKQAVSKAPSTELSNRESHTQKVLAQRLQPLSLQRG